MKVSELVELIKNEKPELFQKIPDKHATVLIRILLEELAKRIDAMEDGALLVQGLGTFTVRQTVRSNDGEEAPIKRVVFRAAKPKAAVHD